MLIKYTVTMDDIVAFNRFHINHSPTHRRMKIINIFIMPIILFAGLSLLFHDLHGTVSAAVFSFLLALTVWKWLPKQVDRQVKRMYREGKNTDILGEKELELDENGIIERGQHTEAKFSWETIERLAFTADYTFIYVSSVSAIIIPNRSIIKEDIERFRDYVKEIYQKTRKVENNSGQTSGITEIPQEIKGVDTRIGEYSGLGISSFILSLIFSITLLSALLILFFGPQEYKSSENSRVPLAGLIFLVTILGSLIGTGLGISGICQRNRKKIFAVTGLILNTALLLFIAVMILIGIFISL